MTRLTHSEANRIKITQLRRIIDAALEEALRHGFYGQLGFELHVQDGTIQVIRRRLEAIER